MAVDVKQIGEQVEKESDLINRIRTEIHRVIVGQEALIDGLIFCPGRSPGQKLFPVCVCLRVSACVCG